MKRWKIYHNPNCSKSRESLALLQQQELDLEVVEYLKSPPSEKELLELIALLGEGAKGLVRTKEEAYQEKPFDTAISSVVAQELSLRPKLIERPIVVVGEGVWEEAVLGRPMENVSDLLLRNGYAKR